MTKVSDLENQVRNEIIIILKDTLEDRKKIIKQFQIMTFFMFLFTSLALSVISIHYEHSFHKFLDRHNFVLEAEEKEVVSTKSEKQVIYEKQK